MSARVATLLILASALIASEAGFPNVERTAGELISDGIILGMENNTMGRCSNITFHRGFLYTVPEGPGSTVNADKHVRQWRIDSEADLLDPHLVKDWGRARHTIAASHHSVKVGNALHVGWHLYSDTTGGPVRTLSRDEIPWPNTITLGNRSSLTPPWTAKLGSNYGSSSDPFWLRKNNNPLAEFPVIGPTGVVGHPIILGDLLIYASADASKGGVATYDISDPTNPRLLDVINQDADGRALGGYWPNIWQHHVVIAQTRGHANERGLESVLHVIDFQDPTDLRVVATIEGSGMGDYVSAQDEFVFSARHKIDMTSHEIVLTLDPQKIQAKHPGVFVHPDFFATQYALPIGNLLAVGGIGTNSEGFSIWAHQAAPDERAPTLGYHIPRDGRTDYPLGAPISLLIHESLRGESIVNGDTISLRPVAAGGALGDPVDCLALFADTDQLTLMPRADLDDDTTYEVRIRAGGITDLAGNSWESDSVFRFSTGPTLIDDGGDPPPPGNTTPSIDELSLAAARIDSGTSAQLTIQASDAESGLQYRVDFGDGSAQTGWRNSNTFSHTFDEPGHYLIQAQVRDAGVDGSQRLQAADTIRITVMDLPTGDRPTRSSPIVVDGDRNRTWCVTPDNDAVVQLDAGTGSRQRIIDLGAASDPRSIAIDPASGDAWVACHDSDEVVIIAADGTIGQRIATGYGSAPISVAIDRDGSHAYVSCHGDGMLRRYRVADAQEVERTYLGPTPGAIAITGDGRRLLVARFISADTGGTVWDVNADDLDDVTPIHLARSVIDDTRANGRGLPNYLSGITISPDGSRAWVTAKKDNVHRGSFRDGQGLLQDQTVRALLCIIDLDTGAERHDERIDIDNSDSPIAIAFNDRGDYAFLVLQGNNHLQVYDALAQVRDGGNSLLYRVDTGAAPQGLWVEGDQVWTHDFLARTAGRRSIADLESGGIIPGPATATDLVQGEALSGDVLAGKRIFYHADERMTAEGYISCASCHRDGGHDGRTWDFTDRGEGLRNTISLRGRAGMGHGNVHWSGNFDEIQDFEHDVRGPFGGSGFMSDSDFNATDDPLGARKAGRSAALDQLAAYVTSLDAATLPRSPARTASGDLSASAQRGRDLMVQHDCLSCHQPENGFTDGTRHDVGTLRTSSGQRLGAALDGIETPTLLDLHATAPYLHDGSAATLEEVFTVVGGTVHQAEDADSTDGTVVSDNSRTFWNGGGYLELAADQSARWDDVLSTAGNEPAQLTLRYAADQATRLRVTIGGVTRQVDLPATSSGSPGLRSEWRQWRGDWTLPAGTHDVRVRTDGAIALDQLTLGGPDHFAAAQPHQRGAALSPAARADVVAFLRSLDAHNVQVPVTTGTIVDFDFSSVFNADVVANGDPVDSTQDGFDGSGRSLLTATAVAGLAGVDDGLPDDAQFDAMDGVHPAVQLGWRDGDDGDNALRLDPGAAAITVAVPSGHYEQVHLFAAAGGGDGILSITFRYADGSEDVHGGTTIDDWFNDSDELATGSWQLIDGLDRTHNGAATNLQNANDPAIFGRTFALDSTRQLASLRIAHTGGGTVVCFGATGERLQASSDGRWLQLRLEDATGIIQTEAHGHHGEQLFYRELGETHRIGPAESRDPSLFQLRQEGGIN